MLRIIGGIYKSRRIKEVKSDLTRPTTDRNKEAIFNIMGQYFDGITMLDLFAGSGSIGIEAISRGVLNVDFVEKANLACKTIKENLINLEINNNFNVIRQDAFSFIKSVNKKYDIIFADPPYAMNKYNILLNIIVSRQLLNENGIIVLEADNKTKFDYRIGNIIKYKEKVFGNTKFAFYKLEV